MIIILQLHISAKSATRFSFTHLDKKGQCLTTWKCLQTKEGCCLVFETITMTVCNIQLFIRTNCLSPIGFG